MCQASKESADAGACADIADENGQQGHDCPDNCKPCMDAPAHLADDSSDPVSDQDIENGHHNAQITVNHTIRKSENQGCKQARDDGCGKSLVVVKRP